MFLLEMTGWWCLIVTLTNNRSSTHIIIFRLYIFVFIKTKPRSCLTSHIPWRVPYQDVKRCFRCCLFYWQKELGLDKVYNYWDQELNLKGIPNKAGGWSCYLNACSFLFVCCIKICIFDKWSSISKSPIL
jgi:hypothetical protein